MALLTSTAPIRSVVGNTIGVLDITYSAYVLQQSIVQNISQFGSDVEAMLLDENYIILAHSSDPKLMYKIINPIDEKSISALISKNWLQNIQPKLLSIKMDGLIPGLQNLSTIPTFSGYFKLQKTTKYSGCFRT